MAMATRNRLLFAARMGDFANSYPGVSENTPDNFK